MPVVHVSHGFDHFSRIELERMNLECQGHLSRECSLNAREARNILKVALGAQAALSRETTGVPLGEVW